MKKNIFLMLAMALFAFTACNDDDDNARELPAPVSSGTFTDERDGTHYGYVQYGKLEWMTENLRFKATTGTFYPDLTESTYYYNDPINKRYYNEFGGLYDFTAATASVPEGWRLPTKEDWEQLISEVGAENLAKAVNLQFGGFYLDPELDRQIGLYDYTYAMSLYWTSTTDSDKTDQYAYFVKLLYNSTDVQLQSMTKANFLNVRCVRNK